MKSTLYAGVMRRIVGEAALALVPAAGAPASGAAVPDWRELLPPSWEIREVDPEPAGFVDHVRQRAREASGPMFLAAPWVPWRELPPALREQTARLALHEHALLVAQAHVPDETRV